MNFRSSVINPYDRVGIIHNQVLIAVAEMPNFPNVEEEVMGNFMLSYMDSIGYNNTGYYLSYFNSMFDNIDDKQNLSNLAIELFKNNEISEIQLYYLQKLDTIISSNIKYNDLFNSNITEIELVFSKDNRISDEDKIGIWGAFSVARYSWNLWNDARLNTKNPWHVIFSNSLKGIVYDGTAVGETWADTKGWVYGLFHRCSKGIFRCAHVACDNQSRRYVVDHTHVE